MNEYKFEDIKLNMIEEFSVQITEKMQNDFCEKYYKIFEENEFSFYLKRMILI